MSIHPLMGSHDETVENSSVRFSSHNDIAWLRDRAGVFVFNSRCQKYWLLAGLEADLWDWFVLGHPLDNITARFAAITKTPQETARQGVVRFVRYLVQEAIWVEAS